MFKRFILTSVLKIDSEKRTKDTGKPTERSLQKSRQEKNGLYQKSNSTGGEKWTNLRQLGDITENSQTMESADTSDMRCD